MFSKISSNLVTVPISDYNSTLISARIRHVKCTFYSDCYIPCPPILCSDRPFNYRFHYPDYLWWVGSGVESDGQWLSKLICKTRDYQGLPKYLRSYKKNLACFIKLPREKTIFCPSNSQLY